MAQRFNHNKTISKMRTQRRIIPFRTQQNLPPIVQPQNLIQLNLLIQLRFINIQM